MCDRKGTARERLARRGLALLVEGDPEQKGGGVGFLVGDFRACYHSAVPLIPASTPTPAPSRSREVLPMSVWQRSSKVWMSVWQRASKVVEQQVLRELVCWKLDDLPCLLGCRGFGRHY